MVVFCLENKVEPKFMHQGRVKITKYGHLTAKLGAWMMKPLAAGFVNGVVAIHAHFVWP